MSKQNPLQRQSNLREMLLRAGVGQFNAVLAIPYMMMLPRTCDPYAQGVMLIVSGLQNLLNERGANLEVDGGMGETTLVALLPYAGPRWYDKSWVQLYGDVLSGLKWKGVQRVTRAEELNWSMGHDAKNELGASMFGDVFASPLPWIAAGAALWFGRHHIKRMLKA